MRLSSSGCFLSERDIRYYLFFSSLMSYMLPIVLHLSCFVKAVSAIFCHFLQIGLPFPRLILRSAYLSVSSLFRCNSLSTSSAVGIPAWAPNFSVERLAAVFA